MKIFNTFINILLLSSLLFFTYCNSGSSSNADQASSLLALKELSYTEITPKNNEFTDSMGTGYEYFHLDIPEQISGENVSFDYTFDTGTRTKDIYFIFSNISPSDSSSYPVLSSSMSVTQSALPAATLKPKSLLPGSQTMKGKPEISEFNRHPYAYLNKINPVNMLLDVVSSTEPRYDTAGPTPSTGSFKIDTFSSINATCKAVVSDVATSNGNKTLNIWVADDQWGLYGAGINQGMVDNLSDTFLKTGLDNDIYDWVSNIYGEEWGDVGEKDPNDVLIDPNDQITILLLDIDNDQSANSGVLGYFWAKDNFKTSAISYSNQRIMFYMDSYLYKNHTDEIISALAHELQHMIHFYQKTVLLTNGNTETWIDEMCSMAAEDLVAYNLYNYNVEGPRGVPTTYPAYLTGSAGPSQNTNGRLPIFVYFDEASVTSWYSGNNVLISYSINYALGAYLARNYGGARFFHDVVHNNYTDYRAIEYALDQAGSSHKFGDILARWGVANLLSDRIDTPSDYQYNSGIWFTDSYGSTSYNAGSINMFNYRFVSGSVIQDGPYIYSSSQPMPSFSMPAASNIYYRAADSLNGPQTWNIKLRKNVRMTVVAK